MKISPFKLERFFAEYEFSAEYLLSASDCDGLKQSDLLSWADRKTKMLWENLSLGYTESTGSPLLRAEISKLYTGVHPEQILIVAPQEGIFVALNAILKKGDHVIVTFPGYQSLYEIAQAIGCEITFWKPEEEKKGWYFNPEFLSKNIKRNTKLIIVNFPHNPTGFLPSKEDFSKIIKVARKHNLYFFSDEMYRFLEYDSKDRLASAIELYDKAITLFGMSKTFGLAGLRIGWLITKDMKLYEQFISFKDYTTICPSAPSEVLALIALKNRQKIINLHLKRIKRNLKFIEQFLINFKDFFSWVKPKAGTIGFVKLKIEDGALEFCQTLMRETGIMILPSTVYDYGNSHFRLGFGREDMPEALNKLESYLRTKYPEKIS